MAGKMMRLRKTTNLDLIDRLDAKIFPEDELAYCPSAIWWVLEVDGKLAGFCGLKLEAEPGFRMGYLCRAGLVEEFRGQGLQRELIKVRDKESVKLGIDMNITYVAGSNYPSANNLIRSGYTLYNPQYAYGMKGALYFQKRFTRREA